MKRKTFKLIILISSLVLMVVFLINLYYRVSNYVLSTSYLSNPTKYNYTNEVLLSIPKIKLKSIVKKADNKLKNLNSSLIYYDNINPHNKIIILGHSGMGVGTYFNKLDNLNNNDEVYLYIKSNKYKYIVNNVYLVSEERVEVLEWENNVSKLVLITCDKKNKNRRLVVELYLDY